MWFLCKKKNRKFLLMYNIISTFVIYKTNNNIDKNYTIIKKNI